MIRYRAVRQIHTHTQASYFFTDNIAKFGSGKGAGKILVPPTATCDLAAVYYMSISPLKIRQITRHLIIYPMLCKASDVPGHKTVVSVLGLRGFAIPCFASKSGRFVIHRFEGLRVNVR